MYEDLGQSRILESVARIQKSDGEVMSHRVTWNPRAWQRLESTLLGQSLVKFANLCSGNGEMRFISRGDVIRFSDSVQDVFVGSMIFGYGPIGYGPTRIERVINENPNLIDNLHLQYSAAQGGAAESWQSHTNKHRVRYLGPAFASKFAYFAARKEEAAGEIPLIVDINTSWAMWWFAEIPRSVEIQDSYVKYVQLAHRWGLHVSGNFGVDEVERAIFIEGQGVPHRLPR